MSSGFVALVIFYGDYMSLAAAQTFKNVKLIELKISVCNTVYPLEVFIIPRSINSADSGIRIIHTFCQYGLLT